MPMNTVLVVEDEKPIRQGICAMVRRGPVQVDRVVECRNGLEAMEHLGENGVDLVITDLRMPKMDGMELVRRMDALPRQPLVVVVSGYDDFDYVSGMLRMGVRDYILKPVERERMYELLARLEEELEAARDKQRMERLAALQVLRAALSEPQADQAALRTAARQLAGPELWSNYRVVCLREADLPVDEEPGALLLGAVEGQAVLAAEAAFAARFLRGEEETHCAGLSDAQSGCASLYCAYRQARAARRHAFLQGRCVTYAKTPPAQGRNPAAEMAERVVQLQGIGDADAAQQVLREVLFLAQNGSVRPGAFVDCVRALCRRLTETYAILEEVCEELAAFADPLAWRSAFACYRELAAWMQRFCERQSRAQENQNRHKIQEALDYLHRHFTQEIDMAVVSNHISMNYSQFSSLFKRYTGCGFQDYLRSLRIEEGKRLLRETDLGVRQVSEQAGFKNEKHFMKAYKQVTAVSPTEYRGNTRGAEGRGAPPHTPPPFAKAPLPPAKKD